METKMKDINCFGSTNSQLSTSWYLYLLLFVGLCVFGIGVGSIFFLDNLVRTKLADGLVLREGSDSFRQWTNPPADIFMEIYLLNITNPQEAALGISKPALVDQGPYVFREIRNKVNVTFNGSLITFYEPLYLIFDRSRSVGPLTDEIVQLDLVVAGMSHKFSRCYGGTDCMIRNVVESVLPTFGFDFVKSIFTDHKRSIFKKYTVGDLLLGYEDPFLKEFSPFAKMTGEKVRERVGLFDGKNGSAAGAYTIFNGEGNITAYQQIVSFNGLSAMTAWSTPYANMLNGTVGHAFRPFLKPQDTLTIFAGDLCRSSEMVYDKTVMIQGVETFRYKPPPWSSLPYPQNPDQAGFCTPDTTDCPPEGLLNETACVGEPILMGKPHFLHADPKLSAVFEGFHPDEVHHDTYLYIEPLTGSIISASKHLMFMFPYRESFLSKAGNIHLKPNMADGTLAFPLFWVNETAIVHEAVFNQIRNLAYPAMAAARIVPHLLVATGIAITVVSAGLLLWGLCRQAQRPVIRFELRANKAKSPTMVDEPGAIVPLVNGSRSAASPNKNTGGGHRPPSANSDVQYMKTQVHTGQQTGHSRNPSNVSSITPATTVDASQPASVLYPLLPKASASSNDNKA